jgi:hypothetical protein
LSERLTTSCDQCGATISEGDLEITTPVGNAWIQVSDRLTLVPFISGDKPQVDDFCSWECVVAYATEKAAQAAAKGD